MPRRRTPLRYTATGNATKLHNFPVNCWTRVTTFRTISVIKFTAVIERDQVCRHQGRSFTLFARLRPVLFVDKRLIPRMEFTRNALFNLPTKNVRKSCWILARKQPTRRNLASPGTNSARNAKRSCTFAAKNVIVDMSLVPPSSPPFRSANLR